MKKLID